MNRIRSLAVVGLVGLVGLGCNNKDIKQLKQDVADLKQQNEVLKKYLGGPGPKEESLNAWLIYLAEAVCELEKRTPGIPNDTRICPKDPPHDIKPPPPYPPK